MQFWELVGRGGKYIMELGGKWKCVWEEVEKFDEFKEVVGIRG